MTTTELDLTGSYADSVESGLIVPTSADLNATITAGVAYINQQLITVTEDAKLYTASKDTYVDVGDDAVITYTETVIDAGAPSLASDAIRLAKVVTDGTTVASVVDMRTLTIYNYVFGLVDIDGGSTMELYNNSGATVMVRFGSGSTAGGMPLIPQTSRHVVELVYVKPMSDGGSLAVTK